MQTLIKNIMVHIGNVQVESLRLCNIVLVAWLDYYLYVQVNMVINACDAPPCGASYSYVDMLGRTSHGVMNTL